MKCSAKKYIYTFFLLQIKPEPNMHSMMNDSEDDSGDGSEDDSPKRRRDLTRRPSYRKILNDLGGGEIGTTNLISIN